MNIQEKFNQVLPSHISLDYNYFIEKHAPEFRFIKIIRGHASKSRVPDTSPNERKKRSLNGNNGKNIFF